MDKARLTQTLSSAREKLSVIEHERWAHWQKYMHEKGTRQPDGSLVIPADLVATWDRQIATPYNDLSDKEKDSDREQVDKYLPFLIDYLTKNL